MIVVTVRLIKGVTTIEVRRDSEVFHRFIVSDVHRQEAESFLRGVGAMSRVTGQPVDSYIDDQINPLIRDRLEFALAN